MLTLFDVIVIVIISISAIFGMQKGMLKILLSLALFILTIVATTLIFPLAQQIGKEYSSNQAVINVASGIICYILSVVLTGIISKQLRSLINEAAGGVIDKFLGIIIGLIRGVVIALVVFSFTSVITTENYMDSKNLYDLVTIRNNKYPKWLSKSITFNFLNQSFQTSVNMFSKNFLSNIKLINWYEPNNNSLKPISIQNQIVNTNKEVKIDDLEKELNDMPKE